MNGSMHFFNGNHVLYRSDTNAALSLVSDRYHIVQPQEVLEFFRDLVEDNGFSIETAGTLKGGRLIWALARTNFDSEVVENDLLKTYVLLATSCDKGMATTAQYTSVRVVCNNTMQMSLRGDAFANQVRIRHNTRFVPGSVHAEMGLNAKAVAEEFMLKMQHLASKPLSITQAESVIEKIFQDRGVQGAVRTKRGFTTVMQLFNGTGKGSRLPGVNGTAWGLLNAVTEYVDFHSPARNQNNRLHSSWFGSNAQLKSDTLEILEQV
jgi:phage/plasmid-like protein (TIGR03299 family)